MSLSRFLLLPLLTINLTACSLFTSSPESPAPKKIALEAYPKEIQLFISRASLETTEFEQYKLQGDTFFEECGKLAKGRYYPLYQNVRRLEGQERDDLIDGAAEILELNQKERIRLPEAGTNKNLMDPGQFFLTIKTGEAKEDLALKVAFDSVSAPEFRSAQKLGQLARVIRSYASEVPCGNPGFYGLAPLVRE